MVVQGFLFGIGILAAFAFMANIEMISLAALAIACVVGAIAITIINPALVGIIVALIAYACLQSAVGWYLARYKLNKFVSWLIEIAVACIFFLPVCAIAFYWDHYYY